MDRNIERLIEAASQRALYPEEIKRLSASIRAMESNQMPPEDVLVRRIKELQGKLDDCRARVRKCERNGGPD
ncbi:hypothetical protein LPL18_011610 [Halomonas sp. CUBES01]|uniref:hypothetical protein n=1 Tax=Halomonas sp. CUBES01 TaxID=2897340 RepID=UPI001E3F4DE8|nr:hypothetical protein [Halomonas sp. CUBES01]MEC4767970.1 hypothetical protein [Halomonas sp. CUBES01]